MRLLPIAKLNQRCIDTIQAGARHQSDEKLASHSI
jgi:hypothetical protein